MPPSEADASVGRPMPRVYIVEDDEGERAALVYALAAAGHLSQTFVGAESFLAAVDPATARGCLLTDLHLPGMSGLELVEEMTRRGSRIRMIVMTAYGEVSDAVRAMRAGAFDFLEKPFKPNEMSTVVAKALNAPEAAFVIRAEASSAAAHLAVLTARERAVVDLLASGLMSKQVAHRLGLSARTIEVHRANAMRRLGLRSFSDLVRLTVLAEIGAPR
jgi:two-component system response regulator FixJ